MKKYIVTVSLIVCSFLSISQNLIFENFTENNGLPSTQVYDIFQDENGYLWFGTDRGIARYNGYEFESFGLEDGITSNTVFKFYPQKNGEIWCATFNNKLFHFNSKDYKFIPYEFNDTLAKYAIDAVIDDLIVNPNGSINVAYINLFGVLSIDTNGSLNNKSASSVTEDQFLVLEKTINDEIFGYIVGGAENIKPHTKGGVLISNQKSLFHGYYKSFQFDSLSLFSDKKQVYIKQGDRLINIINNGHSPLYIGKYDANHFYVGYHNGGVCIYDLSGKLISNFLKNKSITFLTRDHENGIWVSTLSSGVFYSKNPEIKSHYFGDDNHVYNLSRDGIGNLWVSLYNGKVYQKNNLSFNLKYTSKSKSPIPIDYCSNKRALTVNGNGNLSLNNVHLLDTIGTYTTISYQDDIILLGGSSAFCMVKNKRETKYISKQRIKDLSLADKGIYLGTQRGLFFYDTLTNQEIKLPQTELSCRIEDIDRKGDQYYIATLGSGVIMMNSDTLYMISKENGLYSNLINEVYLENDSILWACTNAGLNRIKFTPNGEYVVSGLSTNNGLVYNNITDVEVINDTIWVGTRKGLCSFTKSFFNKNKIYKGQSYFLRFLDYEVNGGNVSKKTLQDLTYKQNKITFYFQAISFKSNSSLQYRYKIENLEDDWNYTSDVKLTYPSLPPGTHNLILQVSANGKAWGPIKLMQQFIISPPFYKTTWFKLITIIILGLLIYLFFKIRVLVYNRDVTRELVRLFIQKLKGKELHIVFRESGANVKLKTSEIHYIKSSNNYIEVFTKEKSFTIRHKISQFVELTPDPLEYLRVHRSFIIRIDKVQSKSTNTVQINQVEIPVGRSYLDQLDKILL